MQGITPKQERFAVEYVATGNASEAYRRAYDAGDWTPNAVGVEASRLLDNPKVILKVNEEKERSLAPARASIDWVISHAASIVEKTEESDPKTAVSALTLLSKRFPEFRDASIVDNRSVNISGMDLDTLNLALEAMQNAR